MPVVVCQAPACTAPVYAREHCSRHYRQLLRHGQVLADREVLACAVEGCSRTAVTRGWCHGHYLRWSRTGDLRAGDPLSRDVQDGCSVDQCDRGRHTGSLCRSHARRLEHHGDPLGGGPLRRSTGGGSISHGYGNVPVRPYQRHLVPPGRTKELEHRLVMAQWVGRPLYADEVVHHRNGDRLDNRLDNLELWSTSQPRGQRVQDKVDFALHILRRYAPDAATALGLDLDPATGHPPARDP